MYRAFRKYHRWLAIVGALPLLTTLISGITFTIAVDWLHQRQLAKPLLKIPRCEFLGLGEVFPILIGVGLLGLVLTGLYMTSLFRKTRYLPPS